MAFTPPTKVTEIPEEKEQVPYNHGFSEEEVYKITSYIKELEKRDLVAEPVSLDEFKNYVVPWYRIKRTEDFILNATKVKEKKVREPKAPKEPKPKKLSKKAIQEELTRLVFKMATGEEFTLEEKEFYFKQTGAEV